MMNDQDSKRVADTAIKHMDILFSHRIPNVIGTAIELAIHEHIYDIAEAVRNGVDISLSTGSDITDAIRAGVENALMDAAESILINSKITGA